MNMADVLDGGQAIPDADDLRINVIPNSLSGSPSKKNPLLLSIQIPQNHIESTGRQNIPRSAAAGSKPQASPKPKASPSRASPKRKVDEFEQSTTFLVTSFVNYRLRRLKAETKAELFANPKLRRRTYPWTSNTNRALEDGPRIAPRLGQVDKVAEALQALGDHLDSRYWQSFEEAFPADWFDSNTTEELRNRFLDMSQDLYSNVQDVEDEALYEEKINWGRIITHFCFTSQLATVAVLSKQYELVNQLTGWLTQFITLHLRTWIEHHGGWEGLVDYRRVLLGKSKQEDSAVDLASSVIAGAVLGVFSFLAFRNYSNSN
ncbi:hypothetical protein RvY_10015 [Ramazzottius varieornatus]|uniref:Bcl-2 Bcl-2 homology region 1-3 domain-containing protein n=1 Tax=Ramazzottius varieornatus TaxID=947166 RepID=A0A1D1VDS4_RAMVA|nr:hypothetical protein RvY_10015 [Ramazzottius varieornatus]